MVKEAKGICFTFPKEKSIKKERVSERDIIMSMHHKVSLRESEEMRRFLSKNESPGAFVSKLYYVKKSIEPIIDDIITSAVLTVKRYHEPTGLDSESSEVEQNNIEQNSEDVERKEIEQNAEDMERNETEQNTEDVEQNVDFDEDIPEEDERPSRHFSAMPRKTPYPADLKNLLKSQPKESDESSESQGETPQQFASYMVPHTPPEEEDVMEETPVEKKPGSRPNLVFDKSVDDVGQREPSEAELIRRVDELTEMLVGPLGDAAKNNPVLINELRTLLQRLGYRMDAIMDKAPDLDYSGEVSAAPPAMMPQSQMDGGAVRGCGEAACQNQVCAAKQPILDPCGRYQVPMRHPTCVSTKCSSTAGAPLSSSPSQPPIARGFAVPREPPRGASRTRPTSQERRPMVASSAYAGQASLQGSAVGQPPSRARSTCEREYASEEQLMNPTSDNFPEQAQRAMSKCCALSPCFKPTCKQTYCRDPRKKDQMPP